MQLTLYGGIIVLTDEGGAKKMDNVSQNVSQQKNKGLDKMRKNEKMSISINEFILDNEFLMRFITDNVKDKIYTERTYNISMIESVLINDMDNTTDSYILGYILDEIDIYTLMDKIDELYIYDFVELAEQTQQRNY